MKASVRAKSLVMGILASRLYPGLLRLRGRLGRRGPPTVHYFHQVDDPYSHLAVQKLDALRQRYRVNFSIHLANAPTAVEQGDSQRFSQWALKDARSIASDYGTSLPEGTDQPSLDAITAAQRRLAHYVGVNGNHDFAASAIEAGEALWRGEPATTDPPDASDPHSVVAQGSMLRSKLGHWLSATFFFEGEWYWGVDRLLHLENRLCDLGLSNDPGTICVPRPSPEPLKSGDASHIVLEYFPSLRSPYTAISFDRTIDMVNRTGVTLHLRPVMPMMMRGIPAPRQKQLYIVKDTRREADFYSQPFGKIVDPIGEPVKRAFALLPFMSSIDADVTYCSEYLKAAWAEGIDITQDEGIRHVVEQCGVSWQDASRHFNNPDWQPLLEANVSEMLDAGLWGVPSFRVSGGNTDEPFSCWGQDRLWRVESEIVRRAG